MFVILLTQSLAALKDIIRNGKTPVKNMDFCYHLFYYKLVHCKILRKKALQMD